MTVEELRRRLGDVPGDWEIGITGYNDGSGGSLYAIHPEPPYSDVDLFDSESDGTSPVVRT